MKALHPTNLRRQVAGRVPLLLLWLLGIPLPVILIIWFFRG
jgi:hypothetical protein